MPGIYFLINAVENRTRSAQIHSSLFDHVSPKLHPCEDLTAFLGSSHEQQTCFCTLDTHKCLTKSAVNHKCDAYHVSDSFTIHCEASNLGFHSAAYIETLHHPPLHIFAARHHIVHLHPKPRIDIFAQTKPKQHSTYQYTRSKITKCAGKTTPKKSAVVTTAPSSNAPIRSAPSPNKHSSTTVGRRHHVLWPSHH
jgi:hypothetical protein